MPTSVPVYTLFYFVIVKYILLSLYFIHKDVNFLCCRRRILLSIFVAVKL